MYKKIQHIPLYKNRIQIQFSYLILSYSCHTCQMVQGVLVGMYLSNGSGCPWGDEVEDNFHYFYVCPLFICQRLLLFTQLRDLAYFLNIDILLKGSPDLSFDDNVLIELCPHLYLWNQKTTININIYQFDFVLFTLNLF